MHCSLLVGVAMLVVCCLLVFVVLLSLCVVRWLLMLLVVVSWLCVVRCSFSVGRSCFMAWCSLRVLCLLFCVVSLFNSSCSCSLFVGYRVWFVIVGCLSLLIGVVC